MSARFTAEIDRFATSEGEIQWNRKEISTAETNEHADMKKINSNYLWIFTIASEPIKPEFSHINFQFPEHVMFVLKTFYPLLSAIAKFKVLLP